MNSPSGSTADGSGWRPDPFVRYAHRWWNGSRWTEYVSDGSGSSMVDPEGSELSVPTPVRGTDPDGVHPAGFRRPDPHPRPAVGPWGATYGAVGHQWTAGQRSRTVGGVPLPRGETAGPAERPVGKQIHVFIRVLLGTTSATVVIFYLWFHINREVGRHGWLVGAGLGATMGLIVGHFASDAGRWRGFWAATLAASITVIVISTTTPLAFADTDIPFDSWGRNMVVGSLFGGIGSVRVARRRRRAPTSGGTYAVIGGLFVAAVALGVIAELRGGIRMDVLDTSGRPVPTTIGPETRRCREQYRRAHEVVREANQLFKDSGGSTATPTPDDIDPTPFDNPWFTWVERPGDPPDGMLKYSVKSAADPC